MRTATLFNFLVESTLIGSILIILLLLARPVCRGRVGSRALWMAWLIIALRLLVPLALPNPAMNALKPTLSQDAGIRPMADQVRTRVEDTALDLYWKTFGFDTSRTPIHAFVWKLVYATGNGRFSYLAMIVYAVGVCLSAGWMVLVNLWLYRNLSRCRVGALSKAQQEDYERMCKGRGLRPRAVWRVRGRPSGCCFGLFRPCIAVPEDTPEELLPAMLLHETCHAQSGEAWRGLLRDICCAVHWFNPLVWLAARASRVDGELACDQRAVAPMNEEERRNYARLLISASDISRLSPPSAALCSCMTMRGYHWKERIRRVLHYTPPRAGAVVAFAAACALAAVGMFATAEQPSTANLPTLLSDRLRVAGGSIDAAEEAENYARAFLALDGVAAEADDRPAYISKDQTGWRVILNAAGSVEAYEIGFTDSGALTGYVNNTLDTAYLHPLAVPITNDTEAGQEWCAFLNEFIQRNLPDLWEEYEAMTIVGSGRLDGEQFVVIDLVDGEYKTVWSAMVQVAPLGRIMSLTRP